VPALPLRRSARLLGVLLAVLAAIAILSTTWGRPERRALPPPSPTSSTEPEASTTSEVDRSRVFLQAVPGETTTTLVEAGRAAVAGAVVGPDGAVPGAVVRIERVVGDTVQRRDVRAAADGTFDAAGLPGGRMRVRAFLPPGLTMAQPEIFFLADGERRELRLTLTRHEGPDVRASTAPTSPRAGDLVNLLVWVAEKVVDDQGVARTVPRPGVPVEVLSTGWSFVQGRPVTDDEGVALFTFRCERPTPVTATALVGAGADQRTYPLEVPACASRPAPTTTTTLRSTTTDPDRTTSTTSED